MRSFIHLSTTDSGWREYKCERKKCCGYSSYVPRRLVNLVWLEQRPHGDGNKSDCDFSVSLKLLLHVPWIRAYHLRCYLPVCLSNSASPDLLVTAWWHFLINTWQKYCPWDINCFRLRQVLSLNSEGLYCLVFLAWLFTFCIFWSRWLTLALVLHWQTAQR